MNLQIIKTRKVPAALQAIAPARPTACFQTVAPSARALTLVVAKTPEGLSAPALIDRLSDGYNTVIAGTRFEDLKDRLVRIGTMGYVTDGEILTDIHQISRAMTDLGRNADEAGAMAATAAKLSA